MTILISHDNCYTFKRFLKLWGQSLREKVRFIYYADLAHRTTLPHDITIFTDLERLSPPLLALADEAAQALRAAGVPVLNEPHRVLRRYDLLRALNREGINQFSVFRLSDDRASLRFPAFLRLENEHQGSLSGLLQDAQELDDAIEAALQRGLKKEELLIVEYCDTSDEEGIFRKYSAFQIGDCLATRHVLFSRKWLLKKPDITGTEKTHEEEQYLEQEPHPHAAQLRAIFERAGINYGRIDYSLLDGKIQVWEINTNPSIVPESVIAPERQAGQNIARRKICDALEVLCEQGSAATAAALSRRVPFTPSPEVMRALGVQPMDRLLHPARRAARPFNPQRMGRFLRKVLRR